jgi:hypothetical protein
VINYNVGKSLGIFNVGEMFLEENKTAGLEGKALNPINHSTYGNSIRGPTVVTKW